jgi:Transglycosylase-like domain
VRRALAIALSTGAAALPAVAPAQPAQQRHPSHRLLPRTVLDRALARMERAERRRDAARRRRAALPDVAVPPALEAIAACESGGNPQAVGGGGAFRGKYQFTYATWAAVGGQGDPAAAPEEEQDRRAALLYATAGPGQWPVCGR